MLGAAGAFTAGHQGERPAVAASVTRRWHAAILPRHGTLARRQAQGGARSRLEIRHRSVTMAALLVQGLAQP